MILIEPPKFRKGWEYREMHPTKEGNRIWRFKLLHGVRIKVEGITTNNIVYHDAAGKPWARHDKFGIYIEEGYAWNGCSPKRWVWPHWWGTPDFKCTLAASLAHDVHYQFSRTAHFPSNRSEVDSLFYDMILANGDFEIARIYHGAVRKWGSWSDKPSNGEFSTLL